MGFFVNFECGFLLNPIVPNCWKSGKMNPTDQVFFNFSFINSYHFDNQTGQIPSETEIWYREKTKTGTEKTILFVSV